MSLPVCCGKEMRASIETGRFAELKCDECGDIVYVKRQITRKPVIIDD